MPSKVKDIGFAVSRNGRPLCVAGLRGRQGVLTVILDWVNRQDGQRLSMHVGGLDSISRKHLVWAQPTVALGDEVLIRVIENGKPTRVRARVKSRRSHEAEEKAWLRKTAQKHGYRLVAITGSR